MGEIYEFDAEMKRWEKVNGAYVEFPYDVEVEFGLKGQVKVQATFDGYPYRGSLVKMGHTCHFLGITQEIRKAIDKEPGEIIHVTIQKDAEPRSVEIPQDWQQMLEVNPQARKFFEQLSFTNRKEYIRWITSAKKVETRTKRLEEALAKLLSGVKHP